MALSTAHQLVETNRNKNPCALPVRRGQSKSIASQFNFYKCMKTEFKFTIQQFELHRLLNVVKHAAPAKAIIPIQECLKIDVNTSGRYITITASDHVNHIEARSNPDSIDESKDFPWSLCVPAKTLISLVALLPAEELITFIYTTHNRKLQLMCLENSYSFGCENPDDYPKVQLSKKMDTRSRIHGFDLEADILNTALDCTAYSISTDTKKPAMNGLFLGASLNKFTAVSTDGKKLVRYIRTDVTIDQDVTMLIPRATVMVLQKILPKQGNISISTDTDKVSINAGHFTLTAPQITERFPNFDFAIQLDIAANTIAFQKPTLLSALTRLHLLANSISPIVSFELTPSSCRILTTDSDLGRNATEYLDLTAYPEESIAIAFRLQDLEAILTNIDSNELMLCMEAPNKSAYIHPVAPAENEDLLILVVPYLTNVYA